MLMKLTPDLLNVLLKLFKIAWITNVDQNGQFIHFRRDKLSSVHCQSEWKSESKYLLNSEITIFLQNTKKFGQKNENIAKHRK
jgi:hypothetical protein